MIISTLFESSDLSVAVSIFFDCKQAGVSGLKPGKLLNSVSSIRNPNNTEIEGIPDLVDQIFELTLTTLDTTNNKSYWTGKDRNREYDNEEILTIELYYDDVLKITYGPGIYDFIINNAQWVFIDIPNGSLLTGGNFGPDGLNEEFIVKYPKTQFDTLYKLKIYHNSGPETIDINISDLTGYINPNEEPTTQYNLVYFPHTNEYRWLRNWFLQTGGTIQPPDDDQLPPVIGPGYGGSVGTFSAKYTTQQISSRRTLNPEVGLEKIAQTTEYAVFNGETEFNNNVLLEQINNDIALYFTIYTNKNKKDPTTDEDNFKDKANIELVNDSNKWVFNRDCLNGNLETASTNFQHQGVDKLIIKNTEIESTVDLKVSKIIFGDNTELSSFTDIQTEVISLGDSLNLAFNTNLAGQVLVLQNQITSNTTDLTALNNDISTTHPDYVEFAKNLKLPNGDIISAGPLQGIQGETGPQGIQGDTGALPSYLFSPSYFKVIFNTAFPSNKLGASFTPSQTTLFGTQALNVGGYTNNASTITIPANGVYEIAYTMLVKSQNNGSSRKVNPTYIRVNNTDPHGIKNAIGSCYLRYNTTTNNRENCQGASTILDLNQNDLISIWSYREGSSGDVYIAGSNGHITIKRIA